MSSASPVQKEAQKDLVANQKVLRLGNSLGSLLGRLKQEEADSSASTGPPTLVETIEDELRRRRARLLQLKEESAIREKAAGSETTSSAVFRKTKTEKKSDFDWNRVGVGNSSGECKERSRRKTTEEETKDWNSFGLVGEESKPEGVKSRPETPDSSHLHRVEKEPRKRHRSRGGRKRSKVERSGERGESKTLEDLKRNAESVKKRNRRRTASLYFDKPSTEVSKKKARKEEGESSKFDTLFNEFSKKFRSCGDVITVGSSPQSKEVSEKVLEVGTTNQLSGIRQFNEEGSSSSTVAHDHLEEQTEKVREDYKGILEEESTEKLGERGSRISKDDSIGSKGEDSFNRKAARSGESAEAVFLQFKEYSAKFRGEGNVEKFREGCKGVREEESTVKLGERGNHISKDDSIVLKGEDSINREAARSGESTEAVFLQFKEYSAKFRGLENAVSFVEYRKSLEKDGVEGLGKNIEVEESENKEDLYPEATTQAIQDDVSEEEEAQLDLEKKKETVLKMFNEDDDSDGGPPSGDRRSRQRPSVASGTSPLPGGQDQKKYIPMEDRIVR